MYFKIFSFKIVPCAKMKQKQMLVFQILLFKSKFPHIFREPELFDLTSVVSL